MKEIKITLDFTNMEYPAQLHRELKIKFELPKGLETVSDDMRQYAQTMLKVFDDVHSNSPNVIFKIIITEE